MGPADTNFPLGSGDIVYRLLRERKQGASRYSHSCGTGAAGSGGFPSRVGLVGSETSRLARLVHSPKSIVAYLRILFRREPDHLAGHNPLGGLSVVAMLLLLLVQTGLGLFAADIDGVYEGPLSFLVAYDTAREISDLHELLADFLLILIGCTSPRLCSIWSTSAKT